MTSTKDRAIVVSALKHAAPYIRLFKGKVFVKGIFVQHKADLSAGYNFFNVDTDRRFGIIKPRSWQGSRRAVGSLQLSRADLLQLRAAMEAERLFRQDLPVPFGQPLVDCCFTGMVAPDLYEPMQAWLQHVQRFYGLTIEEASK